MTERVKKLDYEYVSLREIGSFINFVKELTRRGDEGWDLCGFEYGCAFFKRERTDSGS